MQLTKAHVTYFKSIDDSGEVTIEPDVTVLVGQNESGKTAFLDALHKAHPVEKDLGYDVVEDYPRKGLSVYEEEHKTNPQIVLILKYELSEDEVKVINEDLGYHLFDSLTFSVFHYYDNISRVGVSVPEKSYVQHLVKESVLSKELVEKALKVNTIRELFHLLDEEDLNAESTQYFETLTERFKEPKGSRWELLSYYVWQKHLTPHIPKFLYFDEYMILPGKINLPALKQRKETETLTEEDRTVLALLRLARVDIDSLMNPSGYERSKARLEGISNSITDKIFEYWSQNQDLEVQFDVKPDPNDTPPFNSGNNLYIRIRSQRHRVTVPFNQRSKGFIWFFSFLVWFDSIKGELDTDRDLILLLDEPGLSLHALAQADLLRYIDYLAQSHQILYTTHSPFMVHSEKLHQVRTVEDIPQEGTKVSSRVTGSDPKTLFPLQAALGYTIAQNLFISKQNLLVEGPSDLVYLQFFSSILEQKGRVSLRDGVTIVPVGGLDKLATFIALLGGNQLEIAVLHDYQSRPDARLQTLVHQKLIRDRQILHYGMFRKTGSSSSYPGADVEDLMSESFYLPLFNKAYKKELAGNEIKVKDLPPGERIVERLGRYLDSNSIQLLTNGGFNHYRVANYLASHPVAPSKISAGTLKAFEDLFRKINSLFD